MYVTLFSISRLAPRHRHLGPRDTEKELAQLSKQLSRQFKELAQLLKNMPDVFSPRQAASREQSTALTPY